MDSSSTDSYTPHVKPSSEKKRRERWAQDANALRRVAVMLVVRDLVDNNRLTKSTERTANDLAKYAEYWDRRAEAVTPCTIAGK